MSDIRASYERDGYYFPLNVFPAEEVRGHADYVSTLIRDDAVSSLGFRNQYSYFHALSPRINNIVRAPVILDAVESILGPDFLLWGSSIFIKPPHSGNHVSWHQDLTYWGLDSDKEVAVWLALGPVTRDNGCMRFVPGSHKRGQIEHRDTVDESNILTRGQQACADIDESGTVYAELEPGQASLHHGYLLHASGANHTDTPRLGMVLNYIATSVRQSVSAVDYAMLVRGSDEFGHFLPVPDPIEEFDSEGLTVHRKILEAQSQALYDGADNTDTKPSDTRTGD